VAPTVVTATSSAGTEFPRAAGQGNRSSSAGASDTVIAVEATTTVAASAFAASLAIPPPQPAAPAPKRPLESSFSGHSSGLLRTAAGHSRPFLSRRRQRAAAPLPRRRPTSPSASPASSGPMAWRTGKRPPCGAKAWCGVLIFGFVAMIALWLSDLGKTFQFSIPYLICYNVALIRVPDLLGHAVISSLGDANIYSSPALATTAISCAYMAAMQAYLIILRWVCRNMSSAYLFPRFHFVAQMYYYLFWYMMLMVVSPAGIEDWNFWLMVAMLNGNYLVSNIGVLPFLYTSLRCRSPPPDPPLKILFDAKLAVQDQLADVVSLLIVPAIATSFHICTSLSVAQYPGGVLISLWQRFGALLVARLLSGLLTEEVFRRRVDPLYKADAMELQLLPLDSSHNRLRYLNDLCVGPKLSLESMRNIERCELYFTAVAVACTFAVFQRGDVPARYAFIAFGI